MTRRTSTSLAGCRVAAEHRTAAALGCRSRSDEADAALLRTKSRAAEAGASAPPVGGRLAEPAQACLAGPGRARECRPAPMADTSRSLATATRWAPWRATVVLLAGSTPADSGTTRAHGARELRARRLRGRARRVSRAAAATRLREGRSSSISPVVVVIVVVVVVVIEEENVFLRCRARLADRSYAEPRPEDRPLDSMMYSTLRFSCSSVSDDRSSTTSCQSA